MRNITYSSPSLPIGFRLDVTSVLLVGLIALFQLGGIAVAEWLLDVMEGSGSAGGSAPEQSGSVGLGLAGVGILIVETLVIVGLWRLYCHLAGYWRRFVLVILAGTAVVVMIKAGLAWLGVMGAAYVTALWVLGRWDLDWIVFDLVAIALGVALLGVLSLSVAPVVIIPVLVAFLAWDFVAVDLSDIMTDAMQASAAVQIPNYLIIPTGWRVDRDRLIAYLKTGGEGGAPEDVGTVIGLGDFVLPGLLTVSAAVAIGASTWPVAGSLLGCALAAVALRYASQEREGATPGLPWLNTGALAGFAIGAVLYSGSIATVIGL